jgi:hypothetical protein
MDHGGLIRVEVFKDDGYIYHQISFAQHITGAVFIFLILEAIQQGHSLGSSERNFHFISCVVQIKGVVLC